MPMLTVSNALTNCASGASAASATIAATSDSFVRIAPTDNNGVASIFSQGNGMLLHPFQPRASTSTGNLVRLLARGSRALRAWDPLARSLIRLPVSAAALAWQDEQNPLPFGKMQAMLHCARVEMAMARQLSKSRLAASGKLSRLTSRLIWLI